MGRIIEQLVKVELCDHCDKHEAADYQKCQGCGKKFCYDCGEDQLVQYNQGVFYSSSDGKWCRECEAKPEVRSDPLHLAYAAVKSLRDEHDGWCEQFKKRQEATEKKLKHLINKNGN